MGCGCGRRPKPSARSNPVKKPLRGTKLSAAGRIKLKKLRTKPRIKIK